MNPHLTGIIGLVVLIIMLFSRMPVGFVMALLGFLGFSYIVNFSAALNLVAKDVYTIFSSYSLTVIPLFVLMGQIAFHAGISKKLYDSAYKFLGHMPGGLAMATVGACAGFAAICGSTNATAATMATVALPEMKRYNYQDILSTGVVSAGGSLGILIPPSVIFIVYGIMVEESIGKLFAAGILPGILLAFLFMVTIALWTKINPKLGPKGPPVSFREKILSLSGLVETLILFVLVMGGLFVGFFTPTEAGAIGAGGSILLALIRRQLTWKGFVQSLFETTRISCMVMVIVAGATIFGHFLAVTRIPFDLARWTASLPLPPYAIIGFIVLVYLIGGCFIDALALIMLTVPIFYPVVKQLGYNPIWFGVIIVLVTQMGVISPPVGVNVYVVNGVAKDVPLEVIFKGALPFLATLVVGTAILIAFPQISLFIPSFMK